MLVHCYKAQLLVNKAENGWVCMDSQENHLTIIDIVKQHSFVFTILIMCMNLGLVWVLQYLCQFDLNVCYRPAKDNIMPDALSWLANANTKKLLSMYDKLNALFTTDIKFTAIIVWINDELWERVLNGYKIDNW